MLRYAITDRRLFLAEGGGYAGLVGRCGELAADGVDFILVREKDLPAGELVALCREVVRATKAGGVRVLVAGRVDVAIAAGLAGVHLGAARGELRPEQVRFCFARAGAAVPFVSVSCHTVSEVRELEARGLGGRASAVLFAPVFGKTIGGEEVSAGVGLEGLRQACEAAGGEVPVYALGGVTAGNAGECVGAGAAGVAGIRMFFGGRE